MLKYKNYHNILIVKWVSFHDSEHIVSYKNYSSKRLSDVEHVIYIYIYEESSENCK